MRIERIACGKCRRARLQRVIVGRELALMFPTLGTMESIPGNWRPVLTLCLHCRTVLFAARLLSDLPAELEVLFPPHKGEKL